MATRQTTLLLKRSNVIGKIPPLSGLTLGEMALNTADAKLYTLFTSGTTGATEVREIGWNRVSKTGDTISGDLIITGGLSATTISAATYQNLPVSGLTPGNNIAISGNNGNFTISVTGATGGGYYLPLSGGTVTGTTYFTQGLSANTISATTYNFDTTNTATPLFGQMNWNVDFGVPQIGMFGGNVVQKVGETIFAYVKNVDTVTLNKGDVVYLYGASGDKISVQRASNTGDTTSSKTLGVVSETIGVNQLGYVITQGTIDGLSLGSYNPGDVVWLSDVPGQFTKTKQYAPNHLVFIGVVQRANNGNGQLYVKPQNGYELDELHNVAVTGATMGDLLSYSPSNGNRLWVNTKTLNGSYTITGNTSIGGNLVVSGNTSLQGLTATTTNINGNLTVTGNTSLQSFTGTSGTINGNLTVTGNTSLQSFTGTSGTINGNLTVTGNTSLQGLTATTISAATYQNLPVTSLTVGSSQISSGATNRILFQSGTTLQQSSNFLYNNTDNRLTLSYSGTSVTPFKVFRDVSGVEETHLELVTTASTIADLRIGKTNNVPSGNATSVGTSRITFLTINNSASIGHYSRGNANIWLKQSLTIFQSGFADGNNNSAAKLNMICAQEPNTNRVGNGFHWYFSNDVSDTSPTDAQRAMWLTRGYTLQLYNGTGSDSGTVKPNSFEIYSADRGGVDGRAAAHFKSEDGTINVIGDLSGFGTSSPGARVDVMATGTTTGETIFRVTNSGATSVLFSIQGNGKMNLLWSGDTDSTIINGTRSGAAATAVGVSTNAGLRSVAIGNSVDVSGIDGVAVGYNINVTNAGASGIAFGATITGGSQNGISFGRSIGRNRVGIAIGRNLQFAGDGNNTHFIGYGMTDSSVFSEAKVFDTFGFGSYGTTTGNLPGLTFRSNNLNQLLLGYYSTEANYSTTGGTNWIGIKTGATPSGAINAFQLYSAAVTPGNAAPHFRTENGSTIRLYQNSAVTTTQGVADALTNLGVLSASTIVPTVQSVVSATTVTPAFTNDLVTITAQAGALTLAAPTGTTINGKDLMIRIKDNGTAQTITWTSGAGGYRAIGVTLPTTTVAGKTTYVGLIYNLTDSRWDAIGVSTEV